MPQNWPPKSVSICPDTGLRMPPLLSPPSRPHQTTFEPPLMTIPQQLRHSCYHLAPLQPAQGHSQALPIHLIHKQQQHGGNSIQPPPVSRYHIRRQHTSSCLLQQLTHQLLAPLPSSQSA